MYIKEQGTLSLTNLLEFKILYAVYIILTILLKCTSHIKKNLKPEGLYPVDAIFWHCRFGYATNTLITYVFF